MIRKICLNFVLIWVFFQTHLYSRYFPSFLHLYPYHTDWVRCPSSSDLTQFNSDSACAVSPNFLRRAQQHNWERVSVRIQTSHLTLSNLHGSVSLRLLAGFGFGTLQNAKGCTRRTLVIRQTHYSRVWTRTGLNPNCACALVRVWMSSAFIACSPNDVDWYGKG